MSSVAFTDAQIIAALSRVDWNFPSVTTPRDSIHNLHWFPGNFIHEIPLYLIQLLSSKGALVVDPFCGSAVTGIEALRLGRRAWLSDINRVALLISRAKLEIMSGPELTSELEATARAFLLSGLEKPIAQAGERGEGTDPALTDWFHPDTLLSLRRLWKHIEKANPCVRPVLEAIFSDTLFPCASTVRSKTSTGGTRRHHWGWIADNVRPRNLAWHDAETIFAEKLARVSNIAAQAVLPHAPQYRLELQDCRALSLESGTVDLIVTSPPYLGMIDYTLANRLTYLWFGWPLMRDRQQEIGARSRRQRRAEPDDYLHHLDQSCTEINRVLKSGSFCAVVIGASRKFPGMASRAVDLFGSKMERIWGPEPRIPTRRRVSEREGSEPQELVCVFRKL
jgi:hypothetical protein